MRAAAVAPRRGAPHAARRLEAQAASEELERFEPQPRETAADGSGDQSTLHRRLDEKLYLVTRGRAGEQWRMPATELHEGETLRQAVRGRGRGCGGR